MTDLVLKREDWCEKPGFWDPYSVAKACVQVLMKDVYPNRQALKIATTQKVTSVAIEPCPGILLYMEPMEFDPEVEKAVDNYILYPCSQRMTIAAGKNSRCALQFLTSYLRKRGALIKWNVSEQNQTSILCQRHIATWATNFIRLLPELDFCAISVIGRYVYYLNLVAEGHDMFYVIDELAKLWGNLFIEIIPRPDLKYFLSEETCIHQAIKIFRSMINNVQWFQFRPTEDMPRSLFPTKERDLYHRYNELAETIKEQTTLPHKYNVNICQQARDTLLKEGREDRRGKPVVTEADVHKPLGNPLCCKKYPPDRCVVNFSARNPGEPYL